MDGPHLRRVRARLQVDLTSEDLDQIEARAAEILARIGLAVPLPAALDRLASCPQVRVAGDRVYFDGDTIRQLLKAQQRPLADADDRIHVSAGGGALNVVDDRTGVLRTANSDDLLRSLRICDRLGLGGDPPIVPSDIPQPLRELALYRLAWENTLAFGGRDVSSIEIGEYVYRMAEVAGKPFELPLYMISPLQANTENLALILHFVDRLPALSVGTMPMPAATAPLLAPGYLAQALAEAIGGYALLTMLAPQARVRFGLKVLAFDPYANMIGCGSPESLLHGQLEIALLAR